MNPDDLRPGALSGDARSVTIDMGHAGKITLPGFNMFQLKYCGGSTVSPTSSLGLQQRRIEAVFGGPAARE